MLPRLADTTIISNPSAGLMIYNLQTATPAFHNGARWNSVAAAANAAVTTDSGIYTITSAVTGFTNGTFPFLNFNMELSTTGTFSNFEDVSITKMFDINSIPMAKSVATSSVNGGIVIEFRSFTPGAITPNYSIKLTNVLFSSCSVGTSGSDFLFEQLSINGIIYGFKNWINNISFSYNTSSNVVGSC